jgi:prephenate dehydrogenase
MSEITIGIIGGTKGMGRWFAQLLAGQGYTVHVTGRSTGMTLPALADICRVVCVSVPIRVTGAVIGKIGPYIKKDALLMDLTSLKRGPVEAMLKSSVSEVIGCHPLFGPQVESVRGLHVVLCPARTKLWLPWLRDVFTAGGSAVIETTPEKHDAMMSIIQGLNHLNTVAMGLVMAELGVTMAELDPFTTPIFEIKRELMEKIFLNNPSLYADIITQNRDVDTVVAAYGRIISSLGDLIGRGDAEALSTLMEKAAQSLRS